MANRWGNNRNRDRLYFGGAPKSLQMVTTAMKLILLLLGRKAMTKLDSILKSRDIILPTKVRPVKAMVFPVVMYGCEMGLRQGTLEAPKNDGIKNFFTLHSMYKKINFLFFHN